ncbi:hypothetical protein IJG14_04825 [bacterium]|nr:hypothetical protein [bacterium]
MKKKTVQFLLRITYILIIVISLYEILTIKLIKQEKTKVVSAAQNVSDKEEQYIPENLNYAEVIKYIKREEGVPEEELESPIVVDNEKNDDDIVTVNPEENINQAKKYLQEAMSETEEARKRYKVKKAYRYYKEYLKFYPDNIDGLLGAGAMATYLGKEEDAKNILMQAYATYPKNPDVHKALGDYSFKFSNYNNAIEYYNLSLSSGNLEDYATNLATAVCYEKLGDIESAKKYFKFSQYLNPDSEIANQRVEMYNKMEQDGYSADPRLYDDAIKPDENNDIELETLILDSQQIK